MIALASNYTRIRISKELTDYRDAVDNEELELHSNMDKTSRQYWHTRRWLDPESQQRRPRRGDEDDVSYFSDEEDEDDTFRPLRRWSLVVMATQSKYQEWYLWGTFQ